MNPEENKPQTEPTTGQPPVDISGDDATVSSATSMNADSPTTDQADVASAIDQLAAAAAGSDATPTPEPTPVPEPEPVTSEPAVSEPATSDTAVSMESVAEETPAPVEPTHPPAADIAAAAAELDAEAGIATPTPESTPTPEPTPEPTPTPTPEPTPTPTSAPTTNPVAPVAAPKKKGGSFRLALILIVAVALVAAIVVFVLFVLTGSKDNNTVVTASENTTEAEAEEISLICNYTSSADDLATSSALASYSLRMIATYLDDDLYEMTTSGTYTYIDGASASEGARQARLAYATEYKDLGLASDPFTSNFPVSGNSFSFSHFADASEINAENAALLSLNANADGTVDTSLTTVRNIYLSKGYTCVRSDENITDGTEEETDVETGAEETVNTEENVTENADVEGEATNNSEFSDDIDEDSE